MALAESKAFDQRSMSMVLLGVDPFFESLRGSEEPMRTMAVTGGAKPFSRIGLILPETQSVQKDKEVDGDDEA